MTDINPKQIRVSDVNALYDIMLSAAEANPELLAADTSAKDHVRQLLTQKLTEISYPMAQNISRLLDTYEAKVARGGIQRATTDTASDLTLALYTFATGVKISRSGTPAPAASQPATPATSAQSTTATPAADQTATAPAADVEEIEMENNVNFTIEKTQSSMIDTTLSSVTGGVVASLATLLASMECAEATHSEMEASNKSIQAVVAQYDAADETVDESSILPMPEYELSGFADLGTENPMVAVLNTLIAQGVTPGITYEEAITRIKNAEEAITQARLMEKGVQRELRRARPKDARPVAVTKNSDVAVNLAAIDELNAHVQVSEQVGSDLFTSSYGADATILGFDVPTLEFDDVHPDVPKVDPTFRFYAPVLCEALHSIAEGEIMWLHGDSGCGKSAFWEQLAGRLNMPFTRMNLDGHLTRSDIIGVNRMLPNEDKQMEMRFVEGILPRAMANPGILLLDEFDLGDPEIMPIFQPILEGNSLVILEDGGRIVHPHPMFRIAITGNTIGLGSPNQMYNNAFEQSAATRDRISSFVEMPYMTPEIEKDVVMARVPGADEDFIVKLIQLANKVRDGFKAGEIHQIFSTRAVLSCAKRYARLAPHFPSEEDAADEIIRTVILGRMDSTSYQVVKGLCDNIFE